MRIRFETSSLNGRIEIPASKSVHNRVSIIRALCADSFEITNSSDSSDSRLLDGIISSLHELNGKTIDCEDAGTPFRFLTAFLSMQDGKEFILTGKSRMQKRPIGALVEALNGLGASIEYLNEEGFPPLRIRGCHLNGGKILIDANTSSQFISALCLIAPLLPKGLEIQFSNQLVSQPYIDMTLQLMAKFGGRYNVSFDEYDAMKCIQIFAQSYQSNGYKVEGDWSGATFFYSMAILFENVDLHLANLTLSGLQGDELIALLADDFGIETSIETNGISLARVRPINEQVCCTFNLINHPDLAIPFIVACALRYPKVTFEGLHHLELKESKRLTALKTELAKLNIRLIYQDGILAFDITKKKQQIKSVAFKSYDDHRIVMALCLVALEGIEVEFDSIECIQKSFPTYFQELEKIGFNIKH